MGNISIGNVKPDMDILYNNELYAVLSCDPARSGRGAGFWRARLKNLKTGQVMDCTLRDSDDVNSVDIEKRKLQYSYKDGELYHFLDLETYEDLALSREVLGDKILFLKDDLKLNGLFYKDGLMDLEIPLTMEMKIADTAPGFKGDTVKSSTKPAKLETGLMVNVPLFIEPGETIKIDTRNKEYMGRV